MATINLLYRSQKNSAFLTCRLQFRKWESEILFRDIFIDAKTNFFITKADWKSYTVNKTKKSKLLDIINLKSAIENEMTELSNFVLTDFNINEESTHTKRWLQNKLDLFYKKAPLNSDEKIIPNHLVPFMEDSLKVNSYKENTLKNNKTVIEKLKSFERYSGTKIQISEINYDFKEEITDFFDHLGYAPSTIERDFGTIRTFCILAKKKGAVISLGFDDFRYKFVEDDVIHPILSLDELKTIEDLKKLPEYLDNARDWLIISSFTGQRISDFLNFHSGLIRNEKGIKLIEFKQKKTGKQMSIPVLEQVQRILDKRKGEFPRKISDQKYNDYIKLVCQEAKISEKQLGYKIITDEKSKTKRRVKNYYPKYELVTSHIGRRSLATNFYGKVPTSDLMYLTGHTRESNFLKYINKSSSDRAHDIAKRFKTLS